MDKKNLIMKKALELFAEQGSEATSIQRITEYCGISKGAFYLHFKSKDELIVAIVEHFTKEILFDIDQVVKKQTSSERLLFDFYITTLQSLEKNVSFTKVFAKEQTHSINQELITILHRFERVMKEIIIKVLDRVYGEQVEKSKYDLAYCVNGFISIYSKLFLFYRIPLDFEKLAHSLVEKTEVLALHVTTPYLTFDIDQFISSQSEVDVTIGKLVAIIKDKLEIVEDSTERESLLLLHNYLTDKQTFPKAIIKGLCENIRLHPDCKDLYYFFRIYFDF
ncbi:TetR/AcrR family transcriptional regulator [Alkalihalobacillus pseudalcaliphilus]|uniref:TetR/AcrR family transcriptional regulator n=1 Tax=Alkalihalobacillus pseudalcaliphilus TaxID=79884 RepID=UPI00064DB463|nr:TetR/AcrR family transcriptional regulator [Alkalihalobacillus pseudalcaliphilus]KMK77724.1 hypothetical protein AB990_04520 [Alkalihalobacillus pseudalcaliphilus]